MYILKCTIVLSFMMHFILANRVDTDEMPLSTMAKSENQDKMSHKATFHLGSHCLS